MSAARAIRKEHDMIKLIACDMDGTLLDSAKRLPAELPEVIAKLKEKGVLFCVASGRQYASLRRDFDAYADDMLFICENGALVMLDNPASGRVMEKCGMRKEGVLRQRLYNKGKFVDVALYAILKDDARPARRAPAR